MPGGGGGQEPGALLPAPGAGAAPDLPRISRRPGRRSIRAAATSPHALAVELVNEMIASVDDFTLLILDDYHVISEDLPIVSFVEHVLEHLPENLRMVIGSRSVYGIPSSSLYVNEELAVLSAHDLRFRAGEVRDLARQYFRIHLTQEQAQEIAVQSDGWITSILLSFQDGALGCHPQAGGRQGPGL